MQIGTTPVSEPFWFSCSAHLLMPFFGVLKGVSFATLSWTVLHK